MPQMKAGSVVERLRSRIVSGELAPGSALRQESLAAEMGVSRLPVRDALSKLAAEGLVEVRPDRGAYVPSLTAEQVVETFDLRVLLECDALAHAIPRHTDRTIRAVRAIQAELEVEDETRRWAAGDRKFHEALYEPSGRPQTLGMIKTLRNTVEAFYVSNLSHGVRRAGWRREHREIIQAVADRDVGHAGSSLVSHLRATQRIVSAAVARGACPP
jgi:DNA-binding GntR family transcriptional regulator